MSIESVDQQLAKLFEISNGTLETISDDLERALIRTYLDQLAKIRIILAEIYAKFGKDVTFSDMQKYNRLSKVEQQLAEELKALGVKTDTQIREGVGYIYEKQYYFSGYQEELLGIKSGIGGLDKDAIRANIVNPLDRIKWPVRHRGNIAALNERIRSALSEGLIQGYGYDKTARNIRDEIGRTQFETIRILRTEGQRAKSAARLAANEKVYAKAEKLGIDLAEVWVATNDSRTRPEHLELQDEPRSEDGTWTFSDGTVTTGPVMSGVARHDIMCRCFTRTKLRDAPDGFEPETMEYYREWAESKGIPTDKYDFKFGQDSAKGIASIKESESPNLSNVEDFEESIRSKKYETAALFDQSGKKILERKGDRTSVVFSEADTKKMRGGIVTHNHPTGRSFSLPDYELMVGNRLKSIRAVGIDHRGRKNTYVLENTLFDSDQNEIDSHLEKFRKRFNARAQFEINKTRQAIRRGENVDAVEMNFRGQESTWERLTKEFNLNYSKL